MLKEVLGKDIEEIDENFLQSLIILKISERKRLDYKKTFNFKFDTQTKEIKWTDKEKIEFLKDVSSFANASGGVIIYGIDDKATGIAQELIGLDIKDEDLEILQNTMEQVMITGIAPRLPRIDYYSVNISMSENTPLNVPKKVLILDIPQSWRTPHRVIRGDHNLFWSRNNATGKYQLDVGELRDAFVLSETRVERIRRFREDRIAKIYADETDVPLYGKAKTVLHLIPIDAFGLTRPYSLKDAYNDDKKLIPLYYDRATDRRYNLDGILTSFSRNPGELMSYAQLYRSGVIEAVDSMSLIRRTDSGQGIIRIDSYERNITKSL